MSASCSHVLNVTPGRRLVDRPAKYRPEACLGRGMNVGRGVRRFFQATVPAFLVVLLVASSPTHASATIVTIATDSAVGKNSLAMPGSQDVLKDAFGKYLAVYVDAGGSVSVVYANSDPTQAGAWSPPSKSPIPAAAYRRPAAVFTSPLTMGSSPKGDRRL